MKKILTIIILLSSENFLEISARLPPTIPVCSRNHPKLSDCVSNVVYGLQPRLASGDLGPGLKVPPLEPFLIPMINFGENRGLQVSLSNVLVRGAGNFKIEKLRVNFNELKMDIILTAPKLDVSGKYKLSFNLVGQPVNSEGDYHVALHETRILASLKAHKYLKNGVEFARVEPIRVRFQRGRAKDLRLTNLFGGNVVLSEIVHAILANNPDYVLKNIQPSVDAYLSKLATEVASKIIDENPLEELFPH